MRLWRRKRRGDQPRPEPMSDKQQLEQLLYRLADVIGDDDESDRFWSGKVRACADQVRAGKAWGLRNFLGLFGGMGSINDQGFSYVLREDLSEAYTLASDLLREHDYEMSRHSGERGDHSSPE
jgi:hypothetical protein